MPNLVEDDQYSDAPDTLEDEGYDNLPRGIQQVEIHNIQTPNKTITITSDQDKDGNSPLVEADRGPSPSTTIEPVRDSASTHSLPAVTASQASHPSETEEVRTASSSATSPHVPSPSPAPSQHSSRPSIIPPEDRRIRRRSVTEARASSRLSGFFNNLIHRREHTSVTGNPIHEEHSSTLKSSTDDSSRPGSPSLRPSTPPPDLPPPSLQELGLSLSVLTSDLSPAHFSTPPSSGAFLAPHYLLLCHAQGLDVLPLTSPPASQPYALVRRVCFKSVVVMEQRGVLVAIAGRRDGVRVYALEEVKRAVEWRIEVELRREREKHRRETSRRLPSLGGRDASDGQASAEKHLKSASHTSLPTTTEGLTSFKSISTPLVPRTPTTQRPKPRQDPQTSIPPPSGHPPPYSSHFEHSERPTLTQSSSLTPPRSRSRNTSVSTVLTGPASRRNTATSIRPQDQDPDAKAELAESSDDEAINIVAAGASGSQALDERTSAAAHQTPTCSSPTHRTLSPTMSRRNRPANLDLSLTRSNAIPVPEPSPAPTLLTLRQALSHSPSRESRESYLDPNTPIGEGEGEAEDDDDDDEDGLSLAQILQESRLPNLPPPGTTQVQQPILIGTSEHDGTTSPCSSDITTSSSYHTDTEVIEATSNRRRRWSAIITQPPITSPLDSPPSSAPTTRGHTPGILQRASSFRSNRSAITARPSTSPYTGMSNTVPAFNALPIPGSTPSIASQSSRSSRFIPRILTNAFNHRRGDDRPSSPSKFLDSESSRRTSGAPIAAQSPPPKLEYVKLPGTKGALLVKAVETTKKSFLAILCGENGEKVELFAGTYRTALGLSRTFILPDSPRSLELQLQGDDLVEVFLVFSQNVFGLEPATVRVREVRIGRAERRAARRRAREVRAIDTVNTDGDQQPEEETNVNVSLGVSVSVGSTVVATGTGPDGADTPPLIATEHPSQRSESASIEPTSDRPSTPAEPTTTSTVAHPEELVALATAQMGPYTTFQQLSFAPQFPLASIADDYVIPPTYPDFIDYRNEHEPDLGADLAQVQFSPPGLPVPVPSAPSKWSYKDPKGVVHGPWKASLMQAWYKDGLLPPDLPVRREDSTEFIILKDLRLQSIDPTHPFRTAVPPAEQEPPSIFQPSNKPLLKPISLLTQPRHFGPPALFFSSRGGHSTTVVDNRGRSVLKGRFMWSKDAQEETKVSSQFRMGDVKRLEAFDVKDRSVLVAMRQGGLEAVDLCDALLKPADESRTALPQFHPSSSMFNRRGPFVWRMGTPIAGTTSSLLPSKGKSSFNHLPTKKMSTGMTKSPSGKTEFSIGHPESEMQDEVIFLGRKADEIYICERNAGSFRILRLCPAQS